MTERRGSEIFGGTLLIGLAILLITGWWWPGIMYVIGIALIVRAVSEGRNWMQERAGLIAIGIGIVFTVLDLIRFAFNFWPILLIAAGLFLLFGTQRMRGSSGFRGGNSDKSKNDLV